MKSLKLITLAVVATTATFANASINDMKPASVSAEIGTLGYGANVAWDVNNKTQLQVGVNAGDVVGMIPCNCEKERYINDVKFDIDSGFVNPYVGVQVRPMDNAFTVGAGVMHVGNDKVNAVATPKTEKTFTVGESNREYTVTADAKVDAEVKFKNKLAPYLTVGVHPNKNKRVSMFGEVGAVYVGGVKTDVKTTGTFKDQAGNDITAQNSAEFAKLQDDIREEFEERVEKNLNGNDKFYPIAKIGATVRF